MIIAKDKVVSVSYELRNTKEGEIVEKTHEQQPLTFLFGHNNMLPKFEDYLLGKKVGDSFEFMLSAADSYGEINPEVIIDIPNTVFSQDGKINSAEVYVGRQLTMQDNSGRKFNGIVIEIKETSVKMDFNHPMAGQTLFFNGQILEIREATEVELQHGHVHQHGHHHEEDHECTNCGKH
jgi:FKBP-type peptidyl-prolyl cis-trans isomerase SlyD